MKSAPKRFRLTFGKFFIILFFIFVLLGRWFEPLGNKQSLLVQKTLYPVFYLSNAIWRPLENIWHRYFYLVGLEAENQKLKNENRELLQSLNESQAQSQSLIHIQSIQDLYKKNFKHLEFAQIITYDPVDPSQGIWINKGSDQGVLVGQSVLSEGGLVGVISKVYPQTAKVIPLLSPQSVVDSEIASSGVRGTLKGEQKTLAWDRRYWVTRMEYLGNAEKIEVGDLVTTSGLDKVFPKGLLIGKVENLKKDEKGLFLSAEVLPEVDFSKLRDVAVVLQ